MITAAASRLTTALPISASLRPEGPGCSLGAREGFGLTSLPVGAAYETGPPARAADTGEHPASGRHSRDPWVKRGARKTNQDSLCLVVTVGDDLLNTQTDG